MNKKIYLLAIAIVAIFIACIYQTYAVFTKEITINNAVTLVADINFANDIIEYQTVELAGNSSKVVKATLSNNSSSTLNYKMWYQASDTNVEVGRLEDTTELPSGTIPASSSKDIYTLINNNTPASTTVNIGAEFSEETITLGSEITEITAVLSSALDLTGVKTMEIYNTPIYNDPIRYKTFIAPIAGEYKIELWGASGGNISSYSGGKGAYTKGNIYLEQGEELHVYVGGAGTSSSGGYNGGGTISSDQANFGSGGGGATDIRLTSGLWNDQASLNSRIMVAAGGGGANYRGENYGEGNGGAGGALKGIDGISQNHSNSYGYGYGIGGSQIAGGGTFWQSASNTYAPVYGSFGQGGGTETTSALVQSAGGGGYYGGGGSAHGGAGGGSSYISGYTGCIAIASQTSTAPKSGCSLGTTDPNCSHHYSDKKFTHATIIAGTASMPTHDGTSTMTGNSGDGYAKIYFLAPYLEGLTDKNIALGANIDLTQDVSCVDIGTGCEIVDVSINDTSALETGTYQVKYTVKDQNNKRFIYSRNLNVVDSASSIAKIDSTYYATLQDAISSSATTKTIQLINNTEECVEVPSTNNITLDLKGKTVTCNRANTSTITNNGTLTINDTSTGGAIISTNGSGINNASTGTVTIVSGSVKGKENGIYNTTSGTINIGLGTNTLSTEAPGVYSTGGSAYGVYMASSGTLNINNGAIYTKNTSLGSAYYKGSCTLTARSGYHITSATATVDGTNYIKSYLVSGSTIMQYRYRNEDCDKDCLVCADGTGGNGSSSGICVCEEWGPEECSWDSWSGWSATHPGNQDQCQKRTCNLDAEGNVTTCGSSSSMSC